MCIIIVKPAGVQLPDYPTICRCAENNPDGFGFVTPKNRPFKTLSFDTFLEKLYKANEDEPMIIHFRVASQGSVKTTNCHPFRDTQTGISFAHNGTLNIQTRHDKTDSETAFRLLLIPAIKAFGLNTKQFTKAVNTIRGYSRFAFLTDDGCIKTYGKFIEHGGCLFSNEGFRY